VEDLTSDVMFEAFGTTLPELLEVSAQAMFSVICDISKIQPHTSLLIEASADDETELLYEFLSTLLTESEINGLFLSQFHITKLKKQDKFFLTAHVFGEKMSRGKGGTVVKGVTYYGLVVEHTPEGYRSHVAMDI
ncbi:MAG: archease, partial [Spirochaetales bacterium]|nr:archease [Spirochaetales bacterium]